MKQDLKINIYLRKVRVNKQGLHPIYIRTTLNGKYWEFSTTKYLEPI